MVGDAAVVLANITLEILDVILLLGQRGGEIVVGSEAFLVVGVGVDYLIGFALALELGHCLLGHGKSPGLEVLQFLHLIGQRLDLGHLLLLLGDERGHGLLVGVDLVDFILDDFIKLGPHHVRIGVQSTTSLIHRPG